jgi:uncharacterized repeat protein (TIGR03943 family)
MQRTEPLPQINLPARTDVQAWAKTAILIGLAAYFGWVIASGNLSNYINERFAWLSYVAVGIFALLGVASAAETLRRRASDLPVIQPPGSEVITWRGIVVVAVPLVLGTLIPSRPLGAESVSGNLSTNAAATANMTAFTTDPLTWNVLDWLRAFHSEEDVTSFTGRQADVVGFVYREAGFPEDTFMVARFTVSCCVADASAIGLPVVWADAPNYPQDTWVRVTGSFEVGEFRGDKLPILKAAAVEVVPQPEHPYLYP